MAEYVIRVKLEEDKEISVVSDSEEKVRKLADDVTEKYFGDSFPKKLDKQ